MLSHSRFLLSYHYFKEDDLEELVGQIGREVDLIADSGAYSAWTQGVEIDIEAYLGWIERWKHLFNSGAALDVIGNAEESFKNTEWLRERWPDDLDLVAVYHSNDGGGLRWLQKYIEAGYDYIGISPWVGSSFSTGGSWLSTAFGRRRCDQRITTWTNSTRFSSRVGEGWRPGYGRGAPGPLRYTW